MIAHGLFIILLGTVHAFETACIGSEALDQVWFTYTRYYPESEFKKSPKMQLIKWQNNDTVVQHYQGRLLQKIWLPFCKNSEGIEIAQNRGIFSMTTVLCAK